MKVVIVGYGWLGRQLSAALAHNGHQLFVTKRKSNQLSDVPAGITGLPLLLGEHNIPSAELLSALHCATVICAVPPGRQQSSTYYESALTELASLLCKAGARGVIHLSSTGIYEGLKGDVDESCELVTRSERVSKLLAGEKALQQVPRCITLRLAGLIGPGRHPGRFVAGKTLEEPDSPINMVHADDVVAAVSLLLAHRDLSRGIFNLSCPIITSRRAFYSQAARQINADIIFSSEKIPDTSPGRRVIPFKFMQVYGFDYRYKSASDALEFCD